MSIDLFVKIVKYNEKTNFYHEVKLYREKNSHDFPEEPNLIQVAIYPGYDRDMIEAIREGNEKDGYGYFPWSRVKLNSLEPRLRESIDKMMHEKTFFDFYEIPLAEMKLYLLDHPIVTDYDSYIWDNWQIGDPVPKRANPIETRLFKPACSFIDAANGFFEDDIVLSEYKMILFFA